MFHPVELLNEWETHNNRPLQAIEAWKFRELWTTERGALPSFEPVPVGDEPDLMLVITTYDRPQGAARVLARLREAVRRYGDRKRTAVLVLHDACRRDYTAARILAHDLAARSLWLDARQRLGKPDFWKMHQTALLVAKAWRPRRALYLQDDLHFDADLLERADRIWSATATDPQRRVLHLFASREDEASGRWVSFQRRDFLEAGCRLTRWFDLSAFMVDRAFFELLGHRMIPIHRNRWVRQPESSSGVGRQLTLRLFRQAHVYQAWPPLVRHGFDRSVMNPEARAKRPMNNWQD